MNRHALSLAVCFVLSGCSGADHAPEGDESMRDEADLGFDAEDEESAVTERAPDDEAVSVAEQALSPRAPLTGTFHMSAMPWGYGWPLTVYARCPAGTIRDRAEIEAAHGAFSAWKGWKDRTNADPTDCSALFEASVQNGHWDDFTWRIFTRRVNLAAGKFAIQSSDPFGANPSRAVDGNTDGDWYNSSVTHTDFDAHAYWQVDLGAIYDLGEVVLYNRTDCCGDRLSNFDIKVSVGPDSYGNMSWQSVIHHPNKAPPRLPLATQALGRYVRVELRDAGYLSLAEVEVFVR